MSQQHTRTGSVNQQRPRLAPHGLPQVSDGRATLRAEVEPCAVRLAPTLRAEAGLQLGLIHRVHQHLLRVLSSRWNNLERRFVFSEARRPQLERCREGVGNCLFGELDHAMAAETWGTPLRQVNEVKIHRHAESAVPDLLHQHVRSVRVGHVQNRQYLPSLPSFWLFECGGSAECALLQPIPVLWDEGWRGRVQAADRHQRSNQCWGWCHSLQRSF
mmetsp:Transcript_94511/g.211865  ORF Transcript_94511/g.211865 Transcript_94511/m.211865 type:complete len:216 (+) Transcript_94511:32-679(+)